MHTTNTKHLSTTLLRSGKSDSRINCLLIEHVMSKKHFTLQSSALFSLLSDQLHHSNAYFQKVGAIACSALFRIVHALAHESLEGVVQPVQEAIMVLRIRAGAGRAVQEQVVQRLELII